MDKNKSTEEVKRCIRICTKLNPNCDECSYISSEKGSKTCTDYLLEDALKCICRLERDIIELNNKQAEQAERILAKLGGK